MAASSDETIAWVLWHTARIEDLTMNYLVARQEQFFDSMWQQAMGIETLRLSELSDCAPDEETRQLVKNAAEQAANQYRLLQSASEVARSALECSLHEVEGMMTRMGIDPAQAQERTASVSGAHTDFHA